MTFPAKVHRAAVVMFVMTCLSGFVYGLWLALFSGPGNFMAGASIAGIVALLFAVAWPHRFEIEDGIVKIRTGFLTIKRVRLETVTRVYESRGWPLSHTLHPVTGLRLSTPKSEVLVIPDDEKGFVNEIARQAPHLRRYGSELRSDGGPGLVIVGE